MKSFVYIVIILNIYFSVIRIALFSTTYFFPKVYDLVMRCHDIRTTNSINKEIHISLDNKYRNTDISNMQTESCVKQYNNLSNISSQMTRILNSRTKLLLDYDFAKSLRQAQPNIKIPLVNDIVVLKQNNSWNVYVIINNANTRNDTYKYYKKANVTLEVNGHIYYNEFPEVKHYMIRVLKYVVPNMKQSGNVSLYDHTTNDIYKDLPYKSLIRQPKRKVAVCTYISNYNSEAEIKFWVAYYLLQKVDSVIFYCSVHCDYFRHLLQKEIDIGYVILYDYPFPLSNMYGPIVLSIQASQISSCVYRHKESFEYIIPHDVDEYFYSELYPYDLYKAINKVYELNPDKLSLAV